MNCVIFFEFDDFVLAGVSKFKPITDLCGCTTTGRRRIRDVALVVSHFESSCDEELFDDGILDVDKINTCFKLRAFLNQKKLKIDHINGCRIDWFKCRLVEGVV